MTTKASSSSLLTSLKLSPLSSPPRPEILTGTFFIQLVMISSSQVPSRKNLRNWISTCCATIFKLPGGFSMGGGAKSQHQVCEAALFPLFLPFQASTYCLISMASRYGMSAVNCTSYPPLQANPDISGIGVSSWSFAFDGLLLTQSQMLVSFVATAYLTFFCCIAKAIIDHVRSATKKTPRLDVWSFMLGTAVLSFSDQQVVTGISIIVAGFLQLQWGLDVYHWQTVANLAWFSAFTHITTLTVYEKKIVPTRQSNRSASRLWEYFFVC
jgi:hypothetical protein